LKQKESVMNRDLLKSDENEHLQWYLEKNIKFS